MRALITCVGFDDFLSITLPWNLRHFESVTVVTSNDDLGTQELCERVGVLDESKLGHVYRFATDAFTRNGEPFNKYRAIEEGLDFMGRRGWIALLDADILIPRNLPALALEEGRLYSPKRRMLPYPSIGPDPKCKKCGGKGNIDTTVEEGPNANKVWRTCVPCDCHMVLVPQESEWSKLSLHRLHSHPRWGNHFSGYFQLFHADDLHLGKAPWHRTDLPNALAGDTYFQDKWPPSHRVRPPFEVLHLGDDQRKNHSGRVTQRLPSPVPPAVD